MASDTKPCMCASCQVNRYISDLQVSLETSETGKSHWAQRALTAEKAIETQNEANRTIADERNQALATLGEATEEIESLDRELHFARVRLGEATEEIESLRRELDLKRARLENQERTIGELQEENRRLKDEIDRIGKTRIKPYILLEYDFCLNKWVDRIL